MKAALTAEITIYGDIGEEVRAASVADQLRAMSGRDLRVRINSGGGSVFEGVAIYNALANHKGRVTVTIDGIAASIASYIAMAAERIEIAENAMVMIHDPFTLGGGNARDLRQSAERLDRVADAMLRGYAAKSQQSPEAVRQIMEAETWYTATEAVEAGFADEVTGALDVAAAVTENLLARAPAHIRAALDAQTRPAVPASTPTPKPAHIPNPNRSSTVTKETTNTRAAAGAPEDFRAAETRRRNDIRSRFSPFRDRADVRDLEARCIDDFDLTAEAAGERLLAKLGESVGPLGGGMPIANDTYASYGQFSVSGGGDPDGFRAAVVDGLLARNGITVDKPHAAARDFAGASIKDIAQASLTRAGRRADDFDAAGIIKAAQTTSDFPAILENVAEKALINGLESEGTATHRNTWTTEGSVGDFKRASRVALGDQPDLEYLPEGGEIKNGNVTEHGAEYVQLESYARIVSISRKALINDDLGALTRTPRAMGMAAARKESDIVYGLLANNPAMRDGEALFSAAHGNLAGSGSGITVESIGQARAAMRKQRSPGAGSFLNVAPTFLIVGADRETEANKLMTQLQADSTANAVPSWITALTLVVDPRIDEFTGGAWFIAGNPRSHDVFEVSYLNGRNTPLIEENEDFRTATMEWRVMFDFGATALDWRAIYMNPGA